MENYATWCKYQKEAAVHLLRWNAEFTERVWAALSADLVPNLFCTSTNALNPITAALLLRKQAPIAIAQRAAKFNINEKQIWALLIDHADPATTSLDDLSDARDQLRLLTAQEYFADQQRLHISLLNHTTKTSKRQAGIAKQPRIKIGDAGKGPTLVDVMKNLALDRRYEELRAKELWQIFLDVLRHQYDLDLVEVASKLENPKYSYVYAGESRQISFKRFENVVSEARSKKKSR